MYFQSWDGHVGTPNWRLPGQPNIRAKLNPVTLLHINKAKRFAKQLLSDVINALASIYCVYCCQNQTALNPKKNSYSALLLTAFPCGMQ